MSVMCDNSFAQKGTLKTHQLVHTEERPYICNVCSQSFRDKRTLTVHQVTHTEERPFVCDACNRSFGCRSLLSSHISLYCVKVCSAVVCVSNQECLAKFLKGN